jgi:hypothetical protein
MGSAARPVSLTPAQVAELLERGVSTEEIARLLVATGTWTGAGAAEIVSMFAHPMTRRDRSQLPVDLGWPGPADDPPPLFAA